MVKKKKKYQISKLILKPQIKKDMNIKLKQQPKDNRKSNKDLKKFGNK